MSTIDTASLDLESALAKFERLELQRLRRYAEKADQLLKSRFLQEQQTFNPSTDANGVVIYEITNASREVVSAVIPPLRLLYSQRDNVSFVRVRGLIGRHAATRGTKEAARLLEILNLYKLRANQILSVDPDMGTYHVDERGEITPIHVPTTREIFEDWLYGEFLHADEERLARIDGWRSIGIHEFLFLSTARQLSVLYSEFSDRIVRPIVDRPGLANLIEID